MPQAIGTIPAAIRSWYTLPRPSHQAGDFVFADENQKRQLEELNLTKLAIIGGRDCQGVTKTPAHGETFKLGDITFKGVHTPCHTQDSICFYLEDGDEKAVFTGDTLFIGGG